MLKKLKTFIFLSIIPFSLGGCNKTDMKTPEQKYKYEHDEIYEKIWETKTVHNESVVMVEDENNLGTFKGRLLYKPTRIISVRDNTLTKEYSENDYKLEDDYIVLTESSEIKRLTIDNVTCKDIPDVIGETYKGKNGDILFTEGCGIILYQLMVTYEHEDNWAGSIPSKQGYLFPNTYEKLINGEDIRIVAHGASTLSGCNPSSKFGMEPYQEGFYDMFLSEMKREYPAANILSYNNAIGGATSRDGKANVEGCVCQYQPDLLVMEFGHNDACWNISVYDFIENMEFMIKAALSSNPDCEIIIISPHMANPASTQYSYQIDYLEPLKELCENYGVALCDFTTLTLDLQTKKDSFSMYANNINHPSDWLQRIFGVALLETFKK